MEASELRTASPQEDFIWLNSAFVEQLEPRIYFRCGCNSPLLRQFFFLGQSSESRATKIPCKFFTDMTESEQLWGSSGYLGAAATVILTALVRDFGDFFFFQRKSPGCMQGASPFPRMDASRTGHGVVIRWEETSLRQVQPRIGRQHDAMLAWVSTPWCQVVLTTSI